MFIALYQYSIRVLSPRKMRTVEIKEKDVSHFMRTIEGTLAVLALSGIFWHAVVNQESPKEDQNKHHAPTIQEQTSSVFDKNEEIISVFSAYLVDLPKKGIPTEYVVALASISDSTGKPYLSPDEIIALYNRDLSAEEATLLLHFRGTNENPLFTVKQLIKTKEYCTLDDAVALASIRDDHNNPLLTGFGVYRICQLDVVPQYLSSFTDSKKPNALLIYPTSDHNNAFENYDAVALFHQIQNGYDVQVAFAEQESEIATAIASVPNIEFLMLAGHGTATTLNLGGDGIIDEKYQLDLSDTELEDAFNKLHAHATIFLNSCSTGEDENNGNNLANFIGELAKGRIIIAATDSFEQREIAVGSLYPLDIKIIRDITYNTKK